MHSSDAVPVKHALPFAHSERHADGQRNADGDTIGVPHAPTDPLGDAHCYLHDYFLQLAYFYPYFFHFIHCYSLLYPFYDAYHDAYYAAHYCFNRIVIASYARICPQWLYFCAHRSSPWVLLVVSKTLATGNAAICSSKKGQCAAIRSARRRHATICCNHALICW